MIILDSEHVELSTAYGAMRTHIFRPAAPGKYPGLLFYSEIFQVTGPIRRTAAMLAGHGYIVAVPEIYHEFDLPAPCWRMTRLVPTVAINGRRPRNSPAMTRMHALFWIT